jgi:translation initiation factor IF-1
MKKILGYIQGNMKRETIEVGDKDVSIINSLINPPLVPVKSEDVYVRRCRLASDAIDCNYGRFRTEDLPKILDLVQGVSLLIGHRKDTAGIARFFNGSIEQIDDVFNPFTGKKEKITYIVPKFYWMKKHSEAEDLRINVDGGIYHQVSLSWWYKKATCSICSKDMRDCEHIPGRVYNNAVAFYYYDEIGDVLEGSIVYKGGQPYTGFYLNDELLEGINECKRIYSSISPDLNNEKKISCEDIINYLRPLNGSAYIVGDIINKGYSNEKIDIITENELMDDVLDLLPLPFKNMVNFTRNSEKYKNIFKVGKKLSNDFSGITKFKDVVKNEKVNNEYFSKKDFIRIAGTFLVEPLYEGIRVQVHKYGESVEVLDSKCKVISDKIPYLIEEIKSFSENNLILDGILLAYQGRTRLTHKDVCDIIYCDKKLENVRLRIKIFDFAQCGELDSSEISLKNRQDILNEVFYETKNIQIVKSQIASHPSEIVSIIEKYATKDGAMIKDASSKYYEKDKWFAYKKRFGIDAEVVDCENIEEENEYVCAVKNDEGLKVIGKVSSKKINANKGDIVKVEVDNVHLENDEVILSSPKIIEIRYDKSEPDQMTVIKRISETDKSSDVCSNSISEFVFYEYNEDNERFFELIIQNGSESGFMKLGRKSGFLLKDNCTSLTEYRESFGCIPSNSKIIDYGYVFDLKNEKCLKKFSLYGKFGEIKGNYIAREIVYHKKNCFLLWKVDF